MHYDREELDELCKSIDLFEYASQTYDFIGKGKDKFTHCPLHIDKTESLSINTENNSFYCFSCGVGGGLLQWLMRIEKLPFNDAIDKLQKLSGKKIKNIKHSSAMKYYKKIKQCYQLQEKQRIEREKLDFSADYLSKFSDEIPQEWVKEGISPEVLKQFNIRIDNNANRIVYPVYDTNGQFIGVKGRTRLKNFKDLKIQKYINYNKIGTVDYFSGMKENKNEIDRLKSVIVFEGLKSVMKANTWNIYNTIAAETSILNNGQIECLLKMGIKEVTIAFDKGVDFKKIKQCTSMLRRFCKVYVVIDRSNLLEDKDAPVDKGLNIWEKLYQNRIKL